MALLYMAKYKYYEDPERSSYVFYVFPKALEPNSLTGLSTIVCHQTERDQGQINSDSGNTDAKTGMGLVCATCLELLSLSRTGGRPLDQKKMEYSSMTYLACFGIMEAESSPFSSKFFPTGHLARSLVTTAWITVLSFYEISNQPVINQSLTNPTANNQSVKNQQTIKPTYQSINQAFNKEF